MTTLREVRPLFAPPRTDVSADGLPAGRGLPVRCLASRGRRSRSVTARRAGLGGDRVLGLLARRRGRARVLQADRGSAGRDRGLPDAARARCRRRWSGIARPASTATAGARRTRSPAFCGQLKVGWQFCEPADPQAKGAVERLQGYAETNFEPGRVFANELDFQDQLDGWFAKVNARTHKTLRERPIDRLRVEREHMAALPAELPDTARRWVTRVAPDPYLRIDTNDYSLDPALGRPARRGPRRPARGHGGRAGHRRDRLPAHAGVRAPSARSPRSITPAPCATAAARRPRRAVEVRPLARYDALIA